jgi:hypothetical protein
MAALDRRFFRERYAAQQILRDTVEDVGRAADLREVAPGVVARIDTALQPTMTGVLVRARGTASFVPLAALPSSASLSPLTAPLVARTDTSRRLVSCWPAGTGSRRRSVRAAWTYNRPDGRMRQVRPTTPALAAALQT